MNTRKNRRNNNTRKKNIKSKKTTPNNIPNVKTFPNVESDLVTIQKSKIDGLGVFAVTDIDKGTKIADYYGKKMKWVTFKNRYGEYKCNSLYTYPMRRIWKIIVAKEEPFRSKNLTNYINEKAGKANAELKLGALYSKKHIRKGDELLLDYPKDYNRYWIKNNCSNSPSNKTRKTKKE